MNLVSITNDQLQQAVEKFLSLDGIEGSVATPYLDGKGIPTVGVGINLTVQNFATQYFDLLNIPAKNRAAILIELGKSHSSDSDLKTKLATANGGTVLPSLTKDQILTLYSNVAIGKPPVAGGAAETFIAPDGSKSIYAKFAEYLKTNHIDSKILGSKEGVALLSLYFNAPATLAKNITKALAAGDHGRADAWFQIRYGTNKGALGETPPSGVNGVATRRDMESSIFGLYDPSDTSGPDLAEALNIYGSFSDSIVDANNVSHTHRDWMMKYEAAYSSKVAVANTRFSDTSLSGSAIANTTVKSLEDSLKPAADAIVAHYVLDASLHPFIGKGIFSATTFNPLDVQVATASGGNTLTASHRDGYVIVGADGLGYDGKPDTAAKDYNSLLIAQGGNVTLDGSASGSSVVQVLLGGSGDDVIKSGSGNTYIESGTGNTLVQLNGGGNDTVVLGISGTTLGHGSDTVDATHSTGAISYYIGQGTTATIHLGSSAPAALNIVTATPSGAFGQATLNVTAQWISPGVWYDYGKHALITTSSSVDPISGVSSSALHIIYQSPTASTSPKAVIHTAATSSILSSILNFFVSPAAADDLSAADVQSLYGASGTAPSTTVITLDHYNGQAVKGLSLGTAPTDAPPANALQINSGNSFTNGILAATEFDNSTGALVLQGPQNAANGVWAINGLGKANAIYGGVGPELIVADSRSIGGSGVANTHAVYIKAGTGQQAIIGSQGSDTLIGGTNTLSSVTVAFAAGSGPQASSHTSAYTLTGTAGFDWITGGGGNALIQAGPGAALIEGGTGADTIIGGAGNDTIYAGLSNYAEGKGDASIINLYDGQGIVADTWLTGVGGSIFPGATQGGTHNANLIMAGSGNTLIFGGLGDDTIYGGAGDDTIVGNDGNKTIYGGSGHSVIYADENTSLQSANGVAWMDAGSAYSHVIRGGGGNGTIFGSGGHDEIHVGGGDMQVNAGNGNTYVDAGSGNVTIVGGRGQSVFDARSGNDQIQIGDGNSFVYAGSGHTTIMGGAGNDTVEAGGGDAVFIGGSGSALVVVGSGTGHTLVQAGTGPTTIELVGGLTKSDLIARRVSGDLVLSDAYSNTTLTMSGYFTSGNGVNLAFQDGSTMDKAAILAATMAPSNGGDDTLVGTDADDVITAGTGTTYIVSSAGNNTLTGGMGDNTIEGGSGADTITVGEGTTYIVGGSGRENYVFGRDAGSVTIAGSHAGAGMDTMAFSAGIKATDITAVRTVGSDDVIMSLGSVSNATIAIVGMLSKDPAIHQIGTFTFADGATLSRADLLRRAETILGTTQDESISGTAGDDYIDGLGGNDSVYGSGGNDTFVYQAGYGHLGVYNSFAAGEAPVLQLGSGIGLGNLHVSIDRDGSYILTDGVAGDSVYLSRTYMSATAGISTVRLSDGTVLGRDDLQRLQMTGSSGSDVIRGTAGADFLDGKGGGDNVYGSGGSDTFVFNQNYGSLTINEAVNPGDASVLRLGAGITQTSLHVTTDGSSLFLSDGIAGDQITLNGMFGIDSSGVKAVQINKGALLTRDQLMAMEMTGTVAGDRIYGTDAANKLDGKGGTDAIFGGGGNDTFVYNRGYGSLTVIESFAAAQKPILQLGAGITRANLSVSILNDAIQLMDSSQGDVIAFTDMAVSANSGVSSVRLSDGTTLTRAQLLSMALTGTTGNDSLSGSSLADVMDGKGGQDTINGNGGADTFVYGLGYGSLELNNAEGGAAAVLTLGAGIKKGDLHVAVSGNALVLTDGKVGDAVTLDLMWMSDNWGVSSVRLSDGTALSRSDLIKIEMGGSSGDDVIYGDTGANLLNGAGGHDTIHGGGGKDTFVFNAGYGYLELGDGYSSDSLPILSMGSGIKSSSLRVAANGYDLHLLDGVPGDDVVLPAALQWSNVGIGEVDFADGTKVSYAQLLHMEMTGTATGETLYGSQDADLIDGKGGGDFIFSRGGNDTIVYNVGYGNLNVDAGGLANLQMGNGITSASIKVTVDDPSIGAGRQIYITDGVVGDRVTLSESERVGITFADGSTLTHAALEAMATPVTATYRKITGTTGADTLTGSAGNELFDGLGGGDTVNGNGGMDSVVFNRGYGRLDVVAPQNGGQVLLRMGAGIRASDITMTYDSSGQAAQAANVYFGDGTTNDLIAYHGGKLLDGTTPLMLLASSSILTLGQLQGSQSMLAAAGTNGGIEDGTAGADLFLSEAHKETAYGHGGNDTFSFVRTHGTLVIDNSFYGADTPYLEMSKDIARSDLTVAHSGGDLVLGDGLAGDSITLKGMYADVGNAPTMRGVSAVTFGDGTSITAYSLRQMAAQAAGLTQAMAVFADRSVTSHDFLIHDVAEPTPRLVAQAH